MRRTVLRRYAAWTAAALATLFTLLFPADAFAAEEIPAYMGEPYAVVNDSVPYFSQEDLTQAESSYEFYTELDALGRCGVCVASVGQDVMPTEERGQIGFIKPSGWHTVKYNGLVDGNYLYNRCHLIGYQLTGENDNVRNLITGTRYLNVEGMLPFENMVADYVQATGNHVLYRVTPAFAGDNLVADGVYLEAQSVEDQGAGLSYHVYCYNVQPGVVIDYATGDSCLSGETEQIPETEQIGEAAETDQMPDASGGGLVWIPRTGFKYHSSQSCSGMKKPTQVTLTEAEERGYTACKKCY